MTAIYSGERYRGAQRRRRRLAQKKKKKKKKLKRNKENSTADLKIDPLSVSQVHRSRHSLIRYVGAEKYQTISQGYSRCWKYSSRELRKVGRRPARGCIPCVLKNAMHFCTRHITRVRPSIGSSILRQFRKSSVKTREQHGEGFSRFRTLFITSENN